MIKILIVDDQNTVRQILKSYLENEEDISIVGFAVDGQAALKQVEALQPDIIIMDIEMPKMDGFTATQIISEQYLSTKIIFFTNHDEINYFNQALKAGANGYLLKRSTPEEIKSAIRAVYYGSFHLNLSLLEKYLASVSQTTPDSSEIVKLQEMLSQQSSLIRELILKPGNNIVELKQPKKELDLETELAELETRIRILERRMIEIKLTGHYKIEDKQIKEWGFFDFYDKNNNPSSAP